MTTTVTSLLRSVATSTDLTVGQEAFGDGLGGWLTGYGLRSKGAGAGNSVWTANTTYRIGDVVIAPASKKLVRCKTGHTAGSSFSSANWETYAYSAYDVYTPPRGLTDYVNAMWAHAHPSAYEPAPTCTFVATGFTLASEVGSSPDEYVWDSAPPVRKIGLVSSGAITVDSLTFEGNHVGGITASPRAPYALEFDTDATTVFLTYRGNGSTPVLPGVGVTVDGRPVKTDDYFRDAGADTTHDLGFKMVFPDDRLKRVKLDLQHIDWRSITVNVGATLTAATHTPTRKKIAVVGNSWIHGYVNHTADPWSIAPTLCRVLGGDYINAGLGGTGYMDDTSGKAYGDDERLDGVEAAAPDLVIVFGAQNDDADTDTAVGAAAAAYYGEIATRLPSAKIIVVGPESVNYNLTASRQANIVAIKAAALAASNVIGGHVIDPHNNGWMTGSGRVGVVNGDGIADFGMMGDAIHPSPFGAQYYARRIVEEIVWLALRESKMTGYGFTLERLLA